MSGNEKKAEQLRILADRLDVLGTVRNMVVIIECDDGGITNAVHGVDGADPIRISGLMAHAQAFYVGNGCGEGDGAPNDIGGRSDGVLWG